MADDQLHDFSWNLGWSLFSCWGCWEKYNRNFLMFDLFKNNQNRVLASVVEAGVTVGFSSSIRDRSWSRLGNSSMVVAAILWGDGWSFRWWRSSEAMGFVVRSCCRFRVEGRISIRGRIFGFGWWERLSRPCWVCRRSGRWSEEGALVVHVQACTYVHWKLLVWGR